MSPVALGGIVLFGLSLAAFAWAVLDPAGHERRQVAANLNRGVQASPSSESASRGAGKRLDGLVARLSPPGTAARLDRLLAKAGRPAAWPVGRLMAAKVLLVAAGLTLAVLLVAGGARPLLVTLALVVAVVGYFLPELLLYSRGAERSQQIDLALPDTLDQMTIAVEAGLGFEGAVARAGANGTGPLAEELVRTIQDMQMGLSRRQAYEALARRADVPGLRRFVRAVVQGDAHGIALAEVLRTQAGEMRVRRRLRAEEQAMKIPVKVTLPLMLCILPVLFIVLLGPVAMNMMAAF